MGKMIVSASVQTIRPFLFFGHKVVSLVFALYCVISGLFSATAIAGQKSSYVIGGFAKNGSDSTILANIRLYLCSVVYPVYGMGFPPQYTSLDSTDTDSRGYFELRGERQHIELMIVKKDSLPDDQSFRYISRATVQNLAPSEDTVTYYLRPAPISTSIQSSPLAASLPVTKTVTGKRVTIAVENLSKKSGVTATVMNLQGAQVASPVLSDDNTFVWDTGKVSRGTYIIRIVAPSGILHLPVTVQ